VDGRNKSGHDEQSCISRTLSWLSYRSKSPVANLHHARADFSFFSFVQTNVVITQVFAGRAA
jgi:hypothetical protein